MKPLQSVLQHWTVDLCEHIKPDFNMAVRRDTDDVRVQRGVMQLAQRVHSRRLVPLFAVGEDVRGF
jgi:hypothetical protein